ncbi:MAG TPA: flagellar protein FlbB [Xanthobacteraceae bacterium]|jgi:flagellar motility protein MotE (MotC chaperone)|nr:flagellar protein FlbB [Xanthobacteraceae bacterium]
MIRYIRDLRLIPIALIASGCLLTLKIADIAFHGSALFSSGSALPASGDVAVTRQIPDATAPAGSKLSWAQQMFNFPNSSGVAPQSSSSIAPIAAPPIIDRDNLDITGSVNTEPAAKPAAGPPAPPGKPANAPPSPGGMVIPTDGVALPTGAERAILERLQQRRQELDNRAHELDVREDLIKSAEKRMDGKIAELKEVEAQIKQATDQKNDAEKARLKGLVTMYESMKPRDAAKIFNGLDSNVLLEVVAQINPRTMADIAAQMSPDVAQRLTVELAEQAQQQNKNGNVGIAALPKIEGQPTPQ